MNPKAFWKSKTLWFNVAGIALWALDKFAGIHVVQPETLLPAIISGNAALRAVTGAPLAVADPPRY